MERATYPSSNGINTIVYYVYEPENPPRAILQLSHGMCEYLERYGEFADFLNRSGILVCGNDHLGHGASVSGPEDFGYFAEKDGWNCLVEDVHRLTLHMKERHPNVPLFLLGHSMGSFVARAYLSRYGDLLDGVILMGTSGANTMTGLGCGVVRALKKARGSRYRSQFISDLAFGTYNARFKPHRTHYDWISSDDEIVDRYNEDPRCTFLFTLAGFLDLFHMLDFISKKDWAQTVPANLPVLLLSGAEDPVGRCGKGVREVHDRLAFAGSKDLLIKLYPHCRHELLNEQIRETVYGDVLEWLNKRI